MCLSKRVYWSESMAKHVAEKCKQKRGIQLKAYQCPNCGQWHLSKRL
jgi:hypothetical protein